MLLIVDLNTNMEEEASLVTDCPPGGIDRLCDEQQCAASAQQRLQVVNTSLQLPGSNYAQAKVLNQSMQCTVYKCNRWVIMQLLVLFASLVQLCIAVGAAGMMASILLIVWNVTAIHWSDRVQYVVDPAGIHGREMWIRYIPNTSVYSIAYKLYLSMQSNRTGTASWIGTCDHQRQARLRQDQLHVHQVTDAMEMLTTGRRK